MISNITISSNLRIYQNTSRHIKYYSHMIASMEKIFFKTENVAKKLGISKQTLMRYEKKGIFPPPRRNFINKWREYTQADVENLKKILGRI